MITASATLRRTLSAQAVIERKINATCELKTSGQTEMNTTIDSLPDNGVYEVLTGDLDGSNREFTVSEGKYRPKHLQIFYNGSGPQTDFEETNPSSGVFTLGFSPDSDSTLTVIYS